MAMRLIDFCVSFYGKSGGLVTILMESNARVDLFPQLAGTLERDHSSRPQHHGITGGGITTPPFSFLFNAEFSESADQDIIP